MFYIHIASKLLFGHNKSTTVIGGWILAGFVFLLLRHGVLYMRPKQGLRNGRCGMVNEE